MPIHRYEPPNDRRQHRIMLKHEVAEGKQARWSELEISGFVQNLSRNLWKVEWLTVLYLNNNRLSQLPSQIGTLINLEHLDASHNHIHIVPHEIGELINLRVLKLGSNRIHSLPLELGKCFQLRTLDLSNNPLNFEIIKYYSEGSAKLLSVLLDFTRYEMVLPPHRPWISTGTPDNNVPAAVFSVMCYNVLCDKLCTKSMYAYCPTWALSWDYRKKGIMGDIIKGNADIITLQEVETEQYYCMFFPELAKHGYDGIFLPKSRVRTMNSDKEKKSVDGCAIFFRKTKFDKVSEYQVEFSRLATRDGHTNTDTDMINRVSTKDNIAIVAVLRTKPGAYNASPVTPPKGLSQLLMVSTAHIHWDPQSPDVKLVQTMMLIEELQKFVREASLKFRPQAPPPSQGADLCNSIPLILCGDFNSLPDSGVYEYLSKGKLGTNHKDFDGQNYPVFMKGRNYNGNLTHNFQLTSAYKDVIPFTNYTFDFKGIIDYIFYSDHSLRLHGVMGLQDEEWFRANKIVGCPHPFVPSDHFPLFAEFSLPALSKQSR